MHAIGVLRGFALAACVCVIAASAVADIKSFNAAMKAKDYKAAASAAASAWPGLDKSRADLAVIAREFGFAAYLSGDFAAARIYGEAASGASRAVGEEPALQIGSDLLWRLAEHRIKPNGDSRTKLFTLLQSRAAYPRIDLITYLSAEAVTAYDFDKGFWRQAVAGAALGEKLTAGHTGYLETNFQFQLLRLAATYMTERNTDTYLKMGQLQRDLMAAIGAAPAGADLSRLEEVYYETMAWTNTLQAHLNSMSRLREKDKIEQDWKAYFDSPGYVAAAQRITPALPEGVCKVSPMDDTDLPDYPPSALFQGMVGTIILKLDIDETGRAYNPRLVAAVPLKHFGDAALKGASKLRYVKREGEPGCTLAQKDKILTIQFTMRAS